MLKQRILTALILVPLVIAGVLYLSKMAIAIIFAVMLLQGAWEWTALAGMKRSFFRMTYVLLIAVLMYYLWPGTGKIFLMQSSGFLAMAWWLIAFFWIQFPELLKQPSVFSLVLKLLSGVFVLLPVWYGLVSIYSVHESGPVWLLYVMSLIWVADSGAYFAGKKFGKHKVAPRVSPGKTWEGVMGAMALVAVYSLAGLLWLPIESNQAMWLAVMSVALVPLSLVGDLFESLMKRHSGMKDSGRLLPGHGGVLDRIDGLTPAVPAFMLMIILAGFV